MSKQSPGCGSSGNEMMKQIDGEGTRRGGNQGIRVKRVNFEDNEVIQKNGKKWKGEMRAKCKSVHELYRNMLKTETDEKGDQN